MKSSFLVLLLIIAISAGFFSFRSSDQGIITGTVNPPDGATAVVAISTTDSVSANVSNGTFSITVKPGSYKVIIDAKPPYKDVILQSIQVSDGAPTNVGEINLSQ